VRALTRVLGRALALTGALCACGRSAVAPAGAREQPVQYEFTIRNSSGELLPAARFVAFAPVKHTATQETLALTATEPFELVTDALGNQALHFQLELPPYGTKVIRVRATVALRDEPVPEALAASGEYLAAARFVESGDPKIQAVAHQIGGSDPGDVAKRVERWVGGHLEDSGYEREDQGALHALATGRGDCTEFMHLFVALARARGIPAREIGGFLAAQGEVPSARSYHNWAEVYLDGAWRVADPQRQVFGERASEYVAMRVLGATEADPLGNSQRFLAFDRVLDVRMN
jgi:transglutaminase-like putative cysteine protease